MDGRDAPGVLVDIRHRIDAGGRSPPAVNLKGYCAGICVLNQRVHQVNAVVLIELAGVVVIADGDAIFLCQLAEFVQLLRCLLGLLRCVESSHGAGNERNAKLGKVGEILLHEVKGYMGGISGNARLLQGLFHVLHRDVLIAPGKLHPGIPHFPCLLDFFQQGQGAVEPKRV